MCRTAVAVVGEDSNENSLLVRYLIDWLASASSFVATCGNSSAHKSSSRSLSTPRDFLMDSSPILFFTAHRGRRCKHKKSPSGHLLITRKTFYTFKAKKLRRKGKKFLTQISKEKATSLVPSQRITTNVNLVFTGRLLRVLFCSFFMLEDWFSLPGWLASLFILSKSNKSYDSAFWKPKSRWEKVLQLFRKEDEPKSLFDLIAFNFRSRRECKQAMLLLTHPQPSNPFINLLSRCSVKEISLNRRRKSRFNPKWK